MTSLLAVCTFLAVVLTVYALGHYFCSLVFLLQPTGTRRFERHPQAAIAVLIAARNEGPLAVRAIQSLFAQDHRSQTDIYLLLNDRSDTSLAYLSQLGVSAAERQSLDKQLALHLASHAPGPLAPPLKLVQRGQHTVYLALTGSDPKSQKINWIVPQLSTPYVAILDCDHEAEPDWLRTSLILLEEQRADMIQGRRQALSTAGFFRFWDSLHQHIGCELFNTAFTRLGLTVFFTGTAAVMRTHLLRTQPFTHCITEDIDFSYGLFMRGHKIIANPFSGSHEETSPDLYSFLARRRRWANGHTTAFFKHLPLLRCAPLSLRDRVQFLFHGTHYLVALGVFVLHLLIGIYFFRELTTLSQITALLTSLIIATMIAQTQRTQDTRHRVLEISLLMAWLAPAFIILMNVLHALMVADLSRAALPISEATQLIGLLGLAAPLSVLLIGLLGFRQLNSRSALRCIVSYPLAFYLDVAGILLGLCDALTEQQHWRAVSRAPV